MLKELTIEEMKEKAKLFEGEEREFVEQMIQTSEAVEAELSEETKRTWGGARPNSGRPALDPEEKASVQVAFRLTPGEKSLLLERFGQEGDTVHKVCQRLAREALEGVGR